LPPGDFDQLTRRLHQVRSRRDILRLAGGAVAVAAAASWGIWCRGSAAAECATPSACGDRHYCNDEQTCICVLTTEGVHRCGQLPPRCELPLCTTSDDCAQWGEGWFCDTPHSGCCTDPPASLSRCIAPCGSTYPADARPAPTPTPIARTEPTATPTETPQATETGTPQATATATVEPTPEPTPEPTEAVLRLSASNEGGLLFYSRRLDGAGEYYFGSVEDGLMRPEYIVFQDAAGESSMLIFNDELVPVNWILDGVAVSVLPVGRDDEGVDPEHVLHSIRVGETELRVELDLLPVDLAAIVDAVEPIVGTPLDSTRAFLENVAGDWIRLAELIEEGGEDQHRWLAAAMAFTTAHAGTQILHHMEEAGLEDPVLSSARSVLGAVGRTNISFTGAHVSSSIGGAIGGMIGGAVIDKVTEQLFPEPPDDPDVPNVTVLLCEGATALPGICHYQLFVYKGDAGPCLRFCVVTLGCFTNICAPLSIDQDKVDKAQRNGQMRSLVGGLLKMGLG
jgi:hypothetical protein